MAAKKLDADDIRSELRIVDVINHFGLKTKASGGKLRSAHCPRCGAKSSSNGIVFNPAKNTWGHYGNGKPEGGECFGDALGLVAVCANLSMRRDYVAVLELGALIAGVEKRELTEQERAERRAYRERIEADRARQAEIADAAVRREAGLKASARWVQLSRVRDTRAARAYLDRRGLNSTKLIEEQYCRSDLSGNVCVGLWSLDDSELINVVIRRNSNSEPKVVGLEACPTAGTLVGRLADIAEGSSVIITEGVMDTLTAVQIWPGRVVLGAHGAARLTAIAEAVAPIVKAKSGKLALVPHADDIGRRCAIKAGTAALAAGLVFDRTLFVVEYPPHKDLNQAYAKGWRP